MIDFVRIHYRDKEVLERHVCNPDNFQEVGSSYEIHSKEIRYPLRTKLDNMEIVVNEKSAFVKNSIHKLKNVLAVGENHNYDDFTFSQVCEIVDYLVEEIPNLNEAYITQLEFGLNIKTCIPAEEILRNMVLMHDLNGHNIHNTYDGDGEYKQFNHCNYFIKIYDKAKQHNLNSNVLRFEIKFRNRKEFNGLGIKYIADLKSKENLQNLFNYLLGKYDQMIIVDQIGNKIPEEVKQKINQYKSSQFWTDHSHRKLRNQKAKYRKEFIQLLEEHNLLKSKTALRKLLNEKFLVLINR